jgi:hypothetical protein
MYSVNSLTKDSLDLIHGQPRFLKLTGKSFQELATLECIRTQCNSEGKVAKYSRFFRPLRTTSYCIPSH